MTEITVQSQGVALDLSEQIAKIRKREAMEKLISFLNQWFIPFNINEDYVRVVPNFYIVHYISSKNEGERAD